MRSHVRFSLLALVACAVVAVSAPSAQAAFGVSKFESLACSENGEIGKPKECNAGTPSQFFPQAGGHPNFGITDFTFNALGTEGNGVKTIRTDLPVGFSTNPQALPLCRKSDFDANLDKAEENKCNANTEAGVQEITVVLAGPTLVPLKGKVFNLEPQTGSPLEFGIDVALPFLGNIHVHSFLIGGVSWHKEAVATEEGIESGDYHEYFTIKVEKSLSEMEAPLDRSRLVFNGKAGIGLLTNPTACPGPQKTTLRVESYLGEAVHTTFTSAPTAAEENCKILHFEPGFAFTPSTTQSDAPDGVTSELTFPQNTSSAEIENSDLRNSTVTLPEGLTINPSAANGLEVCTPEQFGVGTEKTTVTCPPRSIIGSDVLNVPGLPPESLRGNIYLGEEKPGPIEGPPYKIYVESTSLRYGQMVRTEGSVVPNLATGQLTTTFTNNPQGPFNSVKLAFNGGPLANLANPLQCGAVATEGVFTGWSGTTAAPLFSGFTVDSNGEKGACPSSPPFSLTQGTSTSPNAGGATSSFTFNLARADGQQYLAKTKVVLPPGLVGKIPVVPLCAEALANAGTCPAASKIGTVAAAAGAGSSPYTFNGSVYLTGPYQGAPYGLSIVVPVVAGPFNLGTEVTRSQIEVDPNTARVIVTTNLPTIRGGIPVRLKSLTVDVNAQNYLLNPTNCGLLATESTLTSTLGATQNVSSPFQVEGCGSLAFKPTFKATAGGKPSKANGASLETTINQPAGEANLKSVLVQLPKQLPSRLTTLNKACPEKTFAANPYSCDAGAFVGTGRANTPTLPGKLQGPAILVSHGGEAFPDLDLVMEANGVRVIVVGNTKITKGITTTNFKTTPDVPVSSVTVLLPTGPHSALAANGNLCTSSLVMPTTITGQNGKTFKQNTKIGVSNCPVQIVGKKVAGNTAYLTIRTFEAGRISGSGPNLSTVARHLGSAEKQASLKVPLSSGGRGKGKPLRVRVRVGFFPKKHGAATSVAYTNVTFR